ncbi:MAG TPA: TPM domain-containing protein [Azospira sp.]|nr:TPM domain-containing protein [Azospira sp.]
MHLSESERRQIGERAARIEARTGAQLVAAVVGKCDAYPEIPWKAFALAVSMTALVAVLSWQQGALAASSLHGLIAVVLCLLGAGALAALATVFFPPFARLFLDPARRDAELRQYAESFFLTRDLVRTRQRSAVLLLVGLFERSVVILPDRGVGARVDAAELAAVIARMTPALAAGRIAPALLDGLDMLETLLAAKGFAQIGDAGDDEIGDEVIEEKGA